MLSHDLRNPLAVLIGYSDLALEFWPEMTQAEQLDFVDKVGRTGQALNTVLEDTLAVSVIDGDGVAPRQVSVRIDEAVQETLAALTGPVPDVDLQGLKPLTAVVDPGHLGQVLTNLFTNAIKYGGDRVTVDSRSDGDHVLVRVSDSGPGVDATFVPHLFDRFTRSEDARGGAQTGTGLGLYIARSLLLANGGDITYETSPGGGATFCLHLPQAEETVLLTL
jgi:signal transduction histidine kinase